MPITPVTRPFPHHRAALTCLFGLSLAAGAEAGSSSWQWQQPWPQGNELRAMTGDAAVRIAVGARGAIVRSTDDALWQTVPAPTTAILNDVAACNGVLVAVGTGGVALRSSDQGASWAAVTTGTAQDLGQIVCGSAGFATVGRTSLLTSADGLTWQAPATGLTPGPSPFFDPQYAGILFADGRYLVEVGQPVFGPLRASILTSSDGQTWDLQDLATPPGFESAVLFLRAMDYGNGTYTLIHNDAILTSPDAQTWTWHGLPRYQGNPSNPVFTLAYGMRFDPVSQQFLGVADLNDPPIPDNPYPLLTRSTDGATWESVLATDAPGLAALHPIGGVVYGRGSAGTIYRREPDGSTVALAGLAQARALGAIIRDGDRLLAAGANRSDAVILASTDGRVWTPDLAAGEATASMQFNALVRSGSRLLAAGNGAFTGGSSPLSPVVIFGKDAGGTWSPAELGATADLYGITGLAATADGTVVATVVAGESTDPLVLHSTDHGATWQRRTIDSGTFLSSVQAAGDHFVAQAATTFGVAATQLYRSSDGLHWTAETMPVPQGGSVLGIAARGNVVVAVLQGPSACSGCSSVRSVVRSDDGSPWTQVAMLDGIERVAAGETGFFASARDGRLFRSDDGTAWSPTQLPSLSLVTGLGQLDDGGMLAITERGHMLIEAATVGDAVFADGFD